MPLARTATGLLFRDDFTRADGAIGANYAVSGSIIATAISANRLRVDCNTGSGYLRVVGINVKDVHTQALISRSNLLNYTTIMHRCTAGTPPVDLYQYDIGGSTDGTDPSKTRLYRRTANAYTRLGGGYAPPGLGAGVTFRHTFSSIGTDERGWVDGILAAAAVDNVANNQVAGALQFDIGEVGGVGVVFMDDLTICTGRSLSVDGLPAGYKLRAGGVTSAAAVAGVRTTIDLLGALMPFGAIDILDAVGVVYESWTDPAGSYGNDIYAWTPIPGGWTESDLAPASAWLRSDDIPGVRTRGWRLPANNYAAAGVFDYTRQDPEVEQWQLLSQVDFFSVLGQAIWLAVLHEFVLIPKAREVFQINVAWDDGMRIFVDGVKVWDNFGDGFGQFFINLDFRDGEPKRIRVEQVQGPGVQHFGFAWSSASVAPEEPVPSKYLMPVTSFRVADPAPASAWLVSA